MGTLHQQTPENSPTADDELLMWDVASATSKRVPIGDAVGLITDDMIWAEIGRHTPGSATDTLSVTSLAACKYLKIEAVAVNTGALQTLMRFNNDSGNNYAFQYFANNSGSNVTATNGIFNFNAASSSLFIEGKILNIATVQKVGFLHSTSAGATAASAPDYVIFYPVWNNVTDAITRVDLLNSGGGDFAVGSELIVYGHN